MAKNNTKTSESVAVRVMAKSGFRPLEPYKNANEPWRSRCLKCKKVSSPRFKHVKTGTKCRYCAGHLVDEEDAIAKMRKSNFEPLVPYPSSQKPWKSRCLKCQKISSPRYSHVVQRGHCCKHCAPNARVSKSSAHKVFKKANFAILGEFKNAHTSVLLRCIKCGKETKKTYSDVRQGQGCGHCAGKYPLNKDKAREFFLAMGFEPQEEFRTVNLPWKSKCLTCGKTVSPTYGNVSQGKKCPYCKGNKVDEKDAIELMRRYGYEPLEPYSRNNTKWRCIHLTCKNEVFPTYGAINQGYGGCRFCATSGFQYARASYLYFIEHQELNAYKVGIANKQTSVKKDRLRKLGHGGWTAVKTWEFAEGTKPSKAEAIFFNKLRVEMGISQFLSDENMRYGGATETFDRDRIAQSKVIAMINEILIGLSE